MNLVLLIPLFFTGVDEFSRFPLPLLRVLLRDLVELKESVIFEEGFARLEIFNVQTGNSLESG